MTQLAQDLLGGLDGPPVGRGVQDVERPELAEAPPGQACVLAPLGREGDVHVAHGQPEMDLLRPALLEMLASLRCEALGVPHDRQEGRPLGD